MITANSWDNFRHLTGLGYQLEFTPYIIEGAVFRL